MTVSTDIPAATAVRQTGHEPKYSICTHPRQMEIDSHLLESSIRGTATRFGLSKSAVHRHRDSHVPELLARGLGTLDLRGWVETLLRETEDFIRKTEGVDEKNASKARKLLVKQQVLAKRIEQAGQSRPRPI